MSKGNICNEILDDRHNLILDATRKYLATKEREKYYYCDIRYRPEDLSSVNYWTLPEETLAELRAIRERIDNNPKLKNKEDIDYAWRREVAENIKVDEYVADCIWNDEFGRYYPIPFFNEDDWTYEKISLDNYIYCYRFDVCIVNDDGKVEIVYKENVRLSDEEYITLVAYLVENEFCSFTRFSKDFPEISRRISAIRRKYESFFECAILMKEAKYDAEIIRNSLPSGFKG